jgi:hypothetical protein
MLTILGESPIFQRLLMQRCLLNAGELGLGEREVTPPHAVVAVAAAARIPGSGSNYLNWLLLKLLLLETVA